MKQSFAVLAHRPSLADGLEVGAQVEERGHDHVSGGAVAGMEEGVFHGVQVSPVAINTNWSVFKFNIIF
jgi:hypothetical protein